MMADRPDMRENLVFVLLDQGDGKSSGVIG